MDVQVRRLGVGAEFLDSQDAVYEWGWKLQTADATPIALAPTTNVTLVPNTAYAFEGLVVARYAGASTAGVYRVQGCVKIGAAAANTALVGTVGVVAFEDTAGMDLGVTADTTNGRLTLTATGVAATAINWVAKLRFIAVGATLP
jgi:hypothetical protein